MSGPEARGIASEVLDRILAQPRPIGRLLEEAGASLDPRDRRFLWELVLGVVRWLRRLDQVLEAASSRPLDRVDAALRSPLRIGCYQLLFMDRVPPYAAVAEAVAEARRRTHRGGAGFVNGVLRRVARAPELEHWPVRAADPVRRLALETSHPDFLVSRWLDRFGAERTAELLAANNRPKPRHVLSFRDRGGPGELARELAGEGVVAEQSSISPLGLVIRSGDPVATEPFRRGDLYLQDEVSQASALLPPPGAGETVLDVGAAPGGKSFAMLAWEPDLRLVCLDLSPRRLATLRVNLSRLGRKLPLVAADGRRPAFGRRFRRVVLDLPCSGTGTLRKHPELKWRITEAEITRLAANGSALLAGAAPVIEPGGLLVVITCSLEEEENEGVARGFLERHQEFEPLPLAGEIPGPLAPHVQGPGAWRVLTGGDHDGFTVQVLRRR